MRRFAVLAAVLFACVIAGFTTAEQASAHAVVVSTDPGDGSRLKAVPASVSVRFDEPVGLGLGYLRVVDATGKRADTGTATHPPGDDSTITVGVRSGQGDGTYLVSWRVISADGHPVAGSVRFVVGSGALDATPVASGPTVRHSVSIILAAAHLAGFLGLCLLGGGWLVVTVWPGGRERRRVRLLIWTGWAVVLGGAAGELLIQGPYDSGGAASDFWHSDLLRSTLHGTTGQLISVRVLLVGLLGAALTYLIDPDEPLRAGWNLEAAAILGVGVVVTYAASGHSQTAHPRWFAVAVDALHLLAASAWLGGLVLIAVAAYGAHRDPDPGLAELDAGLPLFSKVALGCVATLTVTGTIQAWREVRVLDALWETTYGRLVLAKIGLLLVLVGLGYLARRTVRGPVGVAVPAEVAHPAVLAEAVTVPARRPSAVGGSGGVDAGDVGPGWVPDGPVPPAGVALAQRLRRTVVTEFGIGTVVLVLSAFLISEPPGRAALETKRSKPKIATVQLAPGSQAVVEVSPGRSGPVQISLQLTGNLKPIGLSMTASLPAKQLGPLPVPLQESGPTSYSASGVLLPSSGRWQLTIRVQTSGFDATTAVATVPLS